MSIEQWSILYFIFSLLYYSIILISLYTTLTVKKILLTILAFIAQCAVALAYGIFTNQIGLALVSVLQVVMVIIMFIQYGRLFNENQDS